MRTWKYVTLAALLGTAVLGCDDDSSGGSAGTCTNAFTACGGDISGTWTIDDTCIEGDLAKAMNDMSPLPAECAGAYKSADVQAYGTAEFTNGTQVSNIRTTVTSHLQITSACLAGYSGASVQLTQPICDAFATQMESSGSADPPATMDVNCVLVGSACDCTLVRDSGNITETNTYTVSGSTLTDTSDNSTMEFCVSGTKATVREILTDFDGVAIQYTAHK